MASLFFRKTLKVPSIIWEGKEITWKTSQAFIYLEKKYAFQLRSIEQSTHSTQLNERKKKEQQKTLCDGAEHIYVAIMLNSTMKISQSVDGKTTHVAELGQVPVSGLSNRYRHHTPQRNPAVARDGKQQSRNCGSPMSGCTFFFFFLSLSIIFPFSIQLAGKTFGQRKSFCRKNQLFFSSLLFFQF